MFYDEIDHVRQATVEREDDLKITNHIQIVYLHHGVGLHWQTKKASRFSYHKQILHLEIFAIYVIRVLTIRATQLFVYLYDIIYYVLMLSLFKYLQFILRFFKKKTIISKLLTNK